MDRKPTLKKYTFKGLVWKYKRKAGWHFVTLPKRLSLEIRKNHGLDEEGWGRLKTLAKIGHYEWKTAIWYDSKFGSYLLPIKSEIRRSESVKADSRVSLTLAFKSE